jgi:hypothetical protein
MPLLDELETPLDELLDPPLDELLTKPELLPLLPPDPEPLPLPVPPSWIAETVPPHADTNDDE